MKLDSTYYSALADKIFRVDKRIVIQSTIPWAAVMSIALLLLTDNFRIMNTLKDQSFWLFILVLWVIKFLLDFWIINFNRIEFRGSIITSYFNGKDSGQILDFVSVKQKKTLYTNYLGFEYKEPKGNEARYLLPYGYYDPKTLEAIMQQILKINPHIKLDDDLSKKISVGTYRDKILE